MRSSIIGGLRKKLPKEISDDEYKKFKELLDNEKKREEQNKVKKEFFIEQLSEKVDMLLDLNKTYGPVEAYALTFTRFLTNDFKAHGVDVLWFNWSEIQKYLTNKCLEHDNKGRKMLKKSFREHLLNRGIKTKINRKYNTFKVSKCQPRKKEKKQ